MFMLIFVDLFEFEVIVAPELRVASSNTRGSEKTVGGFDTSMNQ